VPQTTLATEVEFMAWATDVGLVTVQQGSVPRLLARATAELQQFCGRELLPTAAGIARTFSGDGSAVLTIDDLLTCTEVAVEGAAVDTGSYRLEGVGGAPYVYLVRDFLPRSWVSGEPNYRRTGGAWPEGSDNVRVTGTWGYATTMPTGLVEACCILTAYRMVLQPAAWAQTPEVVSQSVGDVSQTFVTRTTKGSALEVERERALDLARPYRRVAA